MINKGLTGSSRIMSTEQSEVIYSNTAKLETGKYPGFGYREEVFEHFRKFRDVAVPLRDGTTIYIDVYRPMNDAPAGALVAWSPYGKHGLKSLAIMPGADVPPEWVSKHVIWEGPDPEFWCPKGYAIIAPDPRGAWSSEGTLTFFSDQESDDGYDLIEWIARQPWSNGKVGMLGVSYLAISQWMIASKQPPSLKAICPWEGLSDIYREAFFHGGIPENRFLEWWQPKSRFSLSPAEDILKMTEAHPLNDGYWRTKHINLTKITVPAFVVASWSDQGMHTRGSIKGFEDISSRQKWLEVTGQKKWRHFYHPSSVARQLAFFDHFLKGMETEVSRWPAVTIEMRESNHASTIQSHSMWPLESLRIDSLYLDCQSMRLSTNGPEESSDAVYNSTSDGRCVFEYSFDRDTELAGGALLNIWMSADEHTEMDIFVALKKLDANRQEVGFRFYSTFSEGPVALGWLRASHRATASSHAAHQPIYQHTCTEALVPGRPVSLKIEIWPFSVLFRAGECLQLVIGGNDLYRFNTGAPELGHGPNNRGMHRIYSGWNHPSRLDLPVVN
jgi:predicted acyl esterase